MRRCAKSKQVFMCGSTDVGCVCRNFVYIFLRRFIYNARKERYKFGFGWFIYGLTKSSHECLPPWPFTARTLCCVILDWPHCATNRKKRQFKNQFITVNIYSAKKCIPIPIYFFEFWVEFGKRPNEPTGGHTLNNAYRRKTGSTMLPQAT